MKILELRLKHFGKFTDKNIQLMDGINVLYGENESGKSTLPLQAVFPERGGTEDVPEHEAPRKFPP